MKIRNGFVSNSSSSSFCIYKKLMTEQQIEEFRELINPSEYDEDRDCDTSLYESGEYFLGDVGMHDRRINDWIYKNLKPETFAMEM